MKMVTTDGPRLSAAPDAISPADARRFPGLARIFLYDAVRSAPSAERVRALLPLARELDAVAGGSDLVRYVERGSPAPTSAAGSRSPPRYAEVVAGKRLEPPEVSAFSPALRRASRTTSSSGQLFATSPGREQSRPRRCRSFGRSPRRPAIAGSSSDGDRAGGTRPGRSRRSRRRGTSACARARSLRRRTVGTIAAPTSPLQLG